jgi:hypothetical protein
VLVELLQSRSAALVWPKQYAMRYKPKHARRGKNAVRVDPLPLARKRLEDAIDELVHTRRYSMRIDGERKLKRVRLPSLYQQVIEAVQSRRAGAGGKWAGQFPFWADALVLLQEIDYEVRKMHFAPHGWDGWTTQRLAVLRARKWRPQDCDVILRYAEMLDGFAKRAEGLFAPKPIPLPDPCPECGEKTVYRKQDGEEVRTPALQIDENGATCGACKANWPVEYLQILGKILDTNRRQEAYDRLMTQGFHDRLIEEHTQLLGRIDKLKAFIGTSEFDSLPEDEQEDLRLQLTAMLEYQDILLRRVQRATASV